MKILYGIQATGNGHIARSRVMAKYFSEHNADVTYFFSGREKDKLFEMDCFGDFLHRRGLTFSTISGKINIRKSVLTNNVPRFVYDVAKLDVSQYDLIITDFEPITAWAGKLKNKHVLGVGHQYAFGASTPCSGENWLGKNIMRHFAPTDTSIGLHWYPYDKKILPPIIDTELTKQTPNNAILVYLPFENQKKVTALLNQFNGQHFIQYSPDLVDGFVNNVNQKQTCYQGFKHDLARASGVICNSGFELISECLHLGLPVLTKPVKDQMEQESNAFALYQLGLAKVMKKLDEQKISHWLNQIALANQANNHATPNVAKELVKWILAGDWQRPEVLSDQLWLPQQHTL
ncbi:MJ1255/VC2487 family glycosyltransferase [Thalassotalea sp. PLHSN55]|uniref:MJ1255/VC2487 family glycosyltransferase n=1 Tax=Thalassotalea sp. PLHSN55 TaxID=3435888 RepID=UPI003F873E54